MYLVIPLDQPEFVAPLGANLIPTELDLIEAITGHPNLTHAWNVFGLKTEVVQEVSRQASATQVEVA